MDLSKYKGLYLQETGEHLSGIEAGLLSLEKEPGGKTVVDSLFRHYHSIKGMSASMGYTPMMKLAHAQEDLLDRIRSGKLSFNREMASALLGCLDAMKDLAARITSDEPLDIDTDALIAVLNLASEQMAEKTAAPEPAQKATPAARDQLKLSSTMKVEGRVFDEMLASVGDIYMVLSSLRATAQKSKSIALKDEVYMLGKTVRGLHNSILSARMLPIEDLTAGLPRVIRDITKDTGKEVALNTEGTGLSLDRSILEGLGSPFVHIIRNAVDHGIETAQERHAAGKLSVGAISIRAFKRKDRIVLEVSDDGRGIDKERLRQKAASKGMSAEKISAMSDKEVLQLICMPGLSTADKVTDTSGRGVGMDVVKEAVEGFGGSLEIESDPGRDTRIIMELPRVTSITKALLVSVSGEEFLLPVSRIEKVVEACSSDVAGCIMDYGGAQIPVFPLGGILGLAERERDTYTIVITDIEGNPGGAGRFAGIRVDDFSDEIDAYVKPLGPPISKLWGASGITIMGDGRPVFLLDVTQIISKALKAKP